MPPAHALYAVDGPIATITLNRPEAKNAFTTQMIRLWAEFLQDARRDAAVRVIIVTGRGDAFCAGGDVRAFAEGKLRSWAMKDFIWEGVHRVALTLEDLDKPVLAAINGVATGAGLDMALMCDLRICADNARLGESYVNMGLVPGDGGAYLLPRLVGLTKALELLLTGDMISAQEALALGMVNRIVPQAQLMDEARGLAAKIADKPPLAVRMIKRAVYQAQSSTLRVHLDYISSQMALLSETADHQEAARAFLERRPPRFRGQ